MTAQPPLSVFSDGTIDFVVRHRDGTETRHKLDLLVVKLCCEGCEQQHKLQIADGRIHPTPEFLVDLAERLGRFGLKDCTPTIAWQVWLATIDAMTELKKSMSETPKSPSGMESTPEISLEPSEPATFAILAG
jgi:hypothetical protein